MKNKLFAFDIPDRLKAILGGFMSLIILGGLVSLNFNLIPTETLDLVSARVITGEGQPRITAVEPLAAPVGEVIRVTGANFHGDTETNRVYFGNTQAEIASLTAGGQTTLSVVVPSRDPGPTVVRIRTSVGEDTFASEFTVEEPAPLAAPTDTSAPATPSALPSIVRIEPLSVAPGDPLYVFGTGFDPAASRNQVLFGEARAPSVEGVFVGEEPALKVTVPPTATSGRVSVRARGQTVESVERITILSADAATPVPAVGADGTATLPVPAGAASPVIDSDRAFTLPMAVTSDTFSLSLFTFVSDADGADDVVVVNANLAGIGGGPSNRMVAGELEGMGRFYSLENIALAAPLAAELAPYRIPVSATDTSGNVGRGEIVICMDRCVADTIPASVGIDEDLSILPDTSADMALPEDDMSESMLPKLDASDQIQTVQPAALRIVPADDYLTLDWDASPGATGYHIYYGTSADALLHRLPAVSATQTFVTDLVPDQRYFFAISATDASGTEAEHVAPQAAVFPRQLSPEPVVSTIDVAPAPEPVVVPVVTPVSTPAVAPVAAGQMPTDLHGSAPARLQDVGPAETLVVSLGMTLVVMLGWYTCMLRRV